jgi:hypothetical protein
MFASLFFGSLPEIDEVIGCGRAVGSALFRASIEAGLDVGDRIVELKLGHVVEESRSVEGVLVGSIWCHVLCEDAGVWDRFIGEKKCQVGPEVGRSALLRTGKLVVSVSNVYSTMASKSS